MSNIVDWHPQERIGKGADYLIPLGDGYILYNSERGEIALTEKRIGLEIAARIAASPQPCRRTPDKIEVQDWWGPTTVTFSNTQRCTLRCTYCYAEGGRLQDRSISEEVARAALTLIISCAKRKSSSATVNFLGEGESTADMKSMRYIVATGRSLAQAEGVDIFFELSTNGVYPAHIAPWLSSNFETITYSLDGLPEQNDRNRVLPNGEAGAFHIVLENMKKMDTLGKSYQVRSTISRGAAATMPRFVEVLADETRVRLIHFEPAFDLGNINDGRVGADEELASEFIAGYREATKVAAARGIEVYYSGSSLTYRNAFCGVSDASNFIVLTDGTISSCTEVQKSDDPRASIFKYGQWNPDSGEFSLNRSTMEKLRTVKKENARSCGSCFARDHCAGDCYAKNAARTGDLLTAPLGSRCVVTRTLVRDNLLRALAHDLAKEQARELS